MIGMAASFRVYVHVWSHTCHSIHVGQKTTSRSQFSTPMFTWVPGVKLRSPGPQGQHLYLLNHPAEAYFWFETRSHVAKAGPEFLGAGTIDIHHLTQPGTCVCVEGVTTGKGMVGVKALGPGYSVFRKGGNGRRRGKSFVILSLSLGWGEGPWPSGRDLSPRLCSLQVPCSYRNNLSSAEDEAQGKSLFFYTAVSRRPGL